MTGEVAVEFNEVTKALDSHVKVDEHVTLVRFQVWRLAS